MHRRRVVDGLDVEAHDVHPRLRELVEQTLGRLDHAGGRAGPRSVCGRSEATTIGPIVSGGTKWRVHDVDMDDVGMLVRRA